MVAKMQSCQRLGRQYIGPRSPAVCLAVAAVQLLRFAVVMCWPDSFVSARNRAVLMPGQVDSERQASRPPALCSRLATYPARLRRPGRFCWLF